MGSSDQVNSILRETTEKTPIEPMEARNTKYFDENRKSSPLTCAAEAFAAGSSDGPSIPCLLA